MLRYYSVNGLFRYNIFFYAGKHLTSTEKKGLII